MLPYDKRMKDYASKCCTSVCYGKILIRFLIIAYELG